MKSLDIDTASTNLYADSNRRVTIEFTGGMQSGRLYQGNLQAVTVPYSSFAAKLKAIQKLGGQITRVSIHNFQLKYPAIAPQELIIEPVSEVQELIAEAEHIVIEPVVTEEVSEVQSGLEAETTTVIPESIIVNDAPLEIIADLKSESVEVESETIATTEEVSEVLAAPEPVVAEVTEVTEVKFENVVVTETEEVSEVIAAPEPVVAEVAEVKLETVAEEISEVVAVPEPIVAEVKLENVVISEAVHEVASELELPVAIPATKKKKAATETVAKAKKPRASTKSSQGFSKRVKHQEDELVTVSEAINFPHLQDEPVLVEEVAEHISLNIASENLVTKPLITEALVHEANEPVATIDLPITVPASRKKKSATASTASEVKPQKTKSSAKSSQRSSKKENHQEVATPIDIAIPETLAEVISVDPVVQDLTESQPIKIEPAKIEPVKIEPEITVKHEEITTEVITEITSVPEMHLPEVPSIVIEPVEHSVPLTPEVAMEPEVLAVKTKKTKASTKGGGFNKPKKSNSKA